MDKKEVKKYVIRLRELVENTEKGRSQVLGLRSKNLDHLRRYWLHLTVLSLGTAGVILTALSTDKNIFNNYVLVIIGAIILVLTSIINILYQNYLLTKENKDLTEKDKNLQKFSDEAINNLMNSLSADLNFSDYVKSEEKLKEKLSAEENVDENKNFIDKYFSDLISSFFVMGIIFTSVSLLELKRIYAILISSILVLAVILFFLRLNCGKTRKSDN